MARDPDWWRWYRWRVKGQPEQLRAVLDALGSSLPDGWQAVSDAALLPFQAKSKAHSRWYHYAAQTGGKCEVWVSIENESGDELRGGWLEYDRPGGSQQNLPAAVETVNQFLDGGIIPAARKLGVAAKDPTFAEEFFEKLPWEAQQSLSAFSNTSRKIVPLNRAESAAWQAFVITAYRGPDNVSYEPLVEWLAAQGWPQPAATELTARLFDQFQLLSRYRETLVVA